MLGQLTVVQTVVNWVAKKAGKKVAWRAEKKGSHLVARKAGQLAAEKVLRSVALLGARMVEPKES